VSERSENRHFRWPHSHLTPPLQETPANIRINLILLENRIPELHFCRWQYGSIFVQILVDGGPKDVCNVTERIMAVNVESYIQYRNQRPWLTLNWQSQVCRLISRYSIMLPVSQTQLWPVLVSTDKYNDRLEVSISSVATFWTGETDASFHCWWTVSVFKSKLINKLCAKHNKPRPASARGISEFTQNVISSSHGQSTHSLKISCKSVEPFSRNLADKQTNKEMNRQQYAVPDSIEGGGVITACSSQPNGARIWETTLPVRQGSASGQGVVNQTIEHIKLPISDLYSSCSKHVSILHWISVTDYTLCLFLCFTFSRTAINHKPCGPHQNCLTTSYGKHENNRCNH